MTEAKPGCCVDGECTPTTCMRLPDDNTCAQCIHVRRCVVMFGQKPEDDACQFYPRRFVRADASLDEKADAVLADHRRTR